MQRSDMQQAAAHKPFQHTAVAHASQHACTVPNHAQALPACALQQIGTYLPGTRGAAVLLVLSHSGSAEHQEFEVAIASQQHTRVKHHGIGVASQSRTSVYAAQLHTSQKKTR
eukprot:434989-Pelagomonas_calceolata.AAC.5